MSAHFFKMKGYPTDSVEDYVNLSLVQRVKFNELEQTAGGCYGEIRLWAGSAEDHWTYLYEDQAGYNAQKEVILEIMDALRMKE